jgi:hypothetical protein
MLFQLRLVSERRTRDQTTFTAMDGVPDLMPANESAIIVDLPVAEPASAAFPAGRDTAPTHTADALIALLPRMSLEIRAAVDASLQKEIAALRSFIGGTLGAHTDRLQGDLAALLPAPRAPELDLPTFIAERRSWSKIVGWSLAVIALVGAAAMSWLWWNRGGEIAALNTDLTAAYAELETLRARPVASPPPVEVAPAAPTDPNAVLPAPDAPDAATASTAAVELVPNGSAVDPPSGQLEPAAPIPQAAPLAPADTTPAAAAPVSSLTPSAATPTASQAQ